MSWLLLLPTLITLRRLALQRATHLGGEEVVLVGGVLVRARVPGDIILLWNVTLASSVRVVLPSASALDARSLGMHVFILLERPVYFPLASLDGTLDCCRCRLLLWLGSYHLIDRLRIGQAVQLALLPLGLVALVDAPLGNGGRWNMMLMFMLGCFDRVLGLCMPFSTVSLVLYTLWLTVQCHCAVCDVSHLLLRRQKSGVDLPPVLVPTLELGLEQGVIR